jgi:hydroxycarboxylate dehydrogenase B
MRGMSIAMIGQDVMKCCSISIQNRADMSHLFQAQELEKHLTRLFEAAGSQTAEARAVAANLVLANLSGHDSHGVGMAPRYIDAILEKGLVPNTSVRVRTDHGMLLGLDGQQGFGQIVGVQAMQLAFERVQQHGACIFSLAHAHHLGRIGHFAEMAVARGWISLHFVNVRSRPVVAAWQGGDGRYGTNPCCIGIPLGLGAAAQEPFILDFATSRVAQGKMRVAHNQGKEVAPGTLIDEHGQPTNRPGVVVVPQSNGRLGALLPFGEHKGFGLAVACELLGGALSGGGTWHQPSNEKRAVYNGMLSIVIDPKALGAAESFSSEALAFADWLKLSPDAPGTDGVQLAGEPERLARVQRHHHGIEVDGNTWSEIVAAGQKVGLN